MSDRPATALSVLAGLTVGALLIVLGVQVAAAQIDPVVAADHAYRAQPPDVPIVVTLAEPSWLSRAIDRGDPLLPVVAGFAILLGFARPLAYCRRRWSRWRRGWWGNAAATAYAAATIVSGALMIGVGLTGSLIALGVAVGGGTLLASDPDTARLPRLSPARRADDTRADVPT